MGFLIVERPLVLATLESMKADCPWLAGAYANLRERLRMAGHRVGYMVDNNPSNRYYVEADPISGQKRMVLAYFVLADTVTIISLKVLV